MSDENPSVLSHVSLGTNDFDRAIAFYDAVLPTLGIKQVMSFPGAVAYGKQFPEFWIQTPIDGQPATCGNGTHVSFIAAAPQQVHDFWQAAVAAGAAPDGEPGPRPHYGDAYYGCFFRDPDGHKIEATYYEVPASAQP